MSHKESHCRLPAFSLGVYAWTITIIIYIDRDLDDQNIVKYYGASLQQQGKKQEKCIGWVMVLEYCPETLRAKMFGSEAKVPAKYSDIYALQLDAMKSVASLAQQICSGLAYMHGNGFLHRDMKPDNILVSIQYSIVTIVYAPMGK